MLAWLFVVASGLVLYGFRLLRITRAFEERARDPVLVRFERCGCVCACACACLWCGSRGRAMDPLLVMVQTRTCARVWVGACVRSCVCLRSGCARLLRRARDPVLMRIVGLVWVVVMRVFEGGASDWPEKDFYFIVGIFAKACLHPVSNRGLTRVRRLY